MFENLSPDMLQKLMMSGAEDPELIKLKRQQALVNQLRQSSMRPAEMQMAGRVAIPNFAGVASNVMNAYGASKMQPEIDSGMQAAGQRNADARLNYARALADVMRRRPKMQEDMNGDPAVMDPNAMDYR